MPAYKDEQRGTWYCLFYYEDWQGNKKKKQKRGFKTKKEALEWENNYKMSANANMDMTLGSFVEIYFRDKAGELKERSVKNKRYMIKTHILPYFENKSMNSITPADIIQWQNTIRAKGFAPTYLRMIQNYFDHVANKEQDMAVEIIIQLGDREYWKENEFNKIYMKRIYGYLLDELKRLFPNFIVANAVVHMDEDSPHMHVVGVPVAYGYTRGLSKQVSKRWVFTPETLSELLQGKLRAYANRMVDIWLQDEIKEKSKGRNHDLTVMEYKVAKETEKYERLKDDYMNAEREVVTLKEEAVDAKKEVEVLREEAVYTRKAVDVLKEQVVDASQEVEVLKELARKAEDRVEQAKQVYELIKYDSEDSLRARCIDAMVENQQLKDENAKLRESLRKAYDFMEKIVSKRAEERHMKCMKCGAELEEGSRYCSHCGEAIADTSVDDVRENIIKRLWSRISLYNRFLIIFVLVLGILACGAYFFNNTLGIIVSMIQIVLLILAMLMKKQIIKSKKGLHILLIIITVLLMISYVNSYLPDYGNAKELEWDEIILHDAIPTPESLLGEIVYNSDEDFAVYIYKITANQFAEYVKKCKENGFTVDVEEGGYYFSAYNGIEYKLSLEFNEENGRMYINVELLEQYGVFEWVENDITKMLPIPKSNIGKIVENDIYLFKAYVARTTIQEYKDYVKACQLKGFEVEVEDTEKTFIAKNSNGYKVQVSYEENNVISIILSEPEYNVEIKVKCEENWIFNTYDVKLYINDSYKRTISHGETETYNFSLKQGVYVIKFVSSEDEKTVRTVNVEIVQDEKYEFKISCGFEKIDIKTVKGKTFVLDKQEESKENIIVNEDEVLMPEAADYYVGKDQEKVIELLRNLGFQNVSIVEVKDIVFGILVQDGEVGEVSIAGIKDFEKNKIFKKTDAVIITYHTYTDEAKTDAEANKQIEENKQNTESLTIDNCAELKQLLNSSNATIEECEAFGKKYSGRIFEFDAVMKYSYSADDSGNIGIAFYAIVDGRTAYRYCFYINNANQYHNGLEQFKFDKYVGVSEEEPVHIKVRMEYFEEGFGRFHVKAVQIDKR